MSSTSTFLNVAGDPLIDFWQIDFKSFQHALMFTNNNLNRTSMNRYFYCIYFFLLRNKLVSPSTV